MLENLEQNLLLRSEDVHPTLGRHRIRIVLPRWGIVCNSSRIQDELRRTVSYVSVSSIVPRTIGSYLDFSGFAGLTP